MTAGATTYTDSYTDTDIEEVARSFLADLKMVASSTRAKTEKWAEDTALDVELFCKKGLVDYVDVTLYDGGAEERAVRYEVNANSGKLVSTRPGGVMWPGNLANPSLELTIGFRTNAAASTAFALPGKRLSWGPSTRDTSHPSLRNAAGRNYVSNSFGFERKDFSK